MPTPWPGLCPGTRDLDLLHCLVGVVGDMNIDADGFSMVIDLGGVRREKGWMEGYQNSREEVREETSHAFSGIPQTLVTLTLAPRSSATSH